MITKFWRWLVWWPIPYRHPVAFFGLSIVLHSGKWADIRLRKGVIVVCWRRKSHYIYFSPNGTPSRAIWMVGKRND